MRAGIPLRDGRVPRGVLDKDWTPRTRERWFDGWYNDYQNDWWTHCSPGSNRITKAIGACATRWLTTFDRGRRRLGGIAARTTDRAGQRVRASPV
jgi:hypothetical protein